MAHLRIKLQKYAPVQVDWQQKQDQTITVKPANLEEQAKQEKVAVAP